MKRILLITFLHGLICCVYSQQKYTFTTYSQEQGLPSGNIRGIYKDTTGYLWLTSEEGVARFDGYNFKIFRHNPVDSTSLPSDIAWYGAFPRFGDIYFETAQKYCKFNPATESFSYKLPFGDTLGAFCIFEVKDRKDYYWVISEFAIFKITKTGAERFALPFSVVPYKWKLITSPDNRVLLSTIEPGKPDVMYVDEETKAISKIKIVNREGLEDTTTFSDVFFTGNNFYLFNNKSAFRFNSGTRTFEWYFDLKHTGSFEYTYSPYLPFNDTLVVIRSETGFLNIVNLRTGEEKLVYVNKKIPEAELNDRRILSCIHDNKGGIWLGTTQMGIINYNLLTGELAQYIYEAGNPNSLPGYWVSMILPDEKGVVWASCDGHGLIKMEPETPLFKTAVPTVAKNSSNSGKGRTLYIRGFLETDDGYWIATGDGLFGYSVQTHQYSNLQHLCPVPRSAHGNIYERILNEGSSFGCLAKDHSGNVWIGQWYGELFIYNPKLQRSFPIRPQTIKNRDESVFRNLYCDRKNRMWISTHVSGFCMVDCNTLNPEKINDIKFEYHFPDANDSTAIPPGIAFVVSEDAQGNIWAGTENGLCRYNEQTKKWKRYINIPGNENSLHNSNVRSICLDKKGTLWIGTNGGGLNRYNREQDNFTHFTTANGLPDNRIYTVVCDDNGMLWMGTNHGLCRFNPLDYSCKNFSEKDGIQNYEYNTNAALKLKDGTLLFGGVAGYNIIDPDKIENKKLIPPVVISSFKIFDRETPIGDGHLKLNYDENSLTFEFAALSYLRSQKNRYSYMLEGVDRDWIFSDTRRYVNYSKLEPGNYTFKVKACNHDGVWNETGAKFQITIRPPWWKTSWAYSLYALLFVGLLVGYALFIRKREKEKTAQVRKEAELKLQSLRAQLNPHFMFNSLTAIHDLILTDQTERSRKYLIRFSKLLRMLLENTEQPFVSLNSELELIDIYLSLEKLRLNDLEYSITTDPSIDKTETYLPNMILQPYIENALWHGLSHKQGDRKLELNVSKKNGAVIYDVKDNGVGRKRSAELKSLYRKQHKSKGMELLNDRFKLLREEFGSEIKTEILDVADNGEVKGTQVVITVPDSLFRKK